MSRVVRYHRYGGPAVLTVEEVPTPDPGPGQVRIRVRAAGVNAIDWKIRRGFLAQGEPLREPASTGIEVSGIIDALGPSVPGWSGDQEVMGQVSTGGAATHVLTIPDNLVVKPYWLAFDQAAALPVAAETAYRTLSQLDVRDGQTLLIHAVAGGVGVIAAQLAQARGIAVIGTASERHHAFLRQLGVHPVTYGDGLAERVRAAPGGINAVLDASGRGVLPVSIELAGGADKVITIADPQASEYGASQRARKACPCQRYSPRSSLFSNAARCTCRSRRPSRWNGPPTPTSSARTATSRGRSLLPSPETSR